MIFEDMWFWAFLISMFLNFIAFGAISGAVPKEVAMKAFDSIPDEYFDKVSDLIDKRFLHDESVLNDILSHLKDSVIEYVQEIEEVTEE